MVSTIRFLLVALLVKLITIAEWMPDSNGKHGEDLCNGLVPDVEWMAGTEA